MNMFSIYSKDLLDFQVFISGTNLYSNVLTLALMQEVSALYQIFCSERLRTKDLHLMHNSLLSHNVNT
jgi:hypothetical protein